MEFSGISQLILFTLTGGLVLWAFDPVIHARFSRNRVYRVGLYFIDALRWCRQRAPCHLDGWDHLFMRHSERVPSSARSSRLCTPVCGGQRRAGLPVASRWRSAASAGAEGAVAFRFSVHWRGGDNGHTLDIGDADLTRVSRLLCASQQDTAQYRAVGQSS